MLHNLFDKKCMFLDQKRSHQFGFFFSQKIIIGVLPTLSVNVNFQMTRFGQGVIQGSVARRPGRHVRLLRGPAALAAGGRGVMWTNEDVPILPPLPPPQSSCLKTTFFFVEKLRKPPSIHENRVAILWNSILDRFFKLRKCRHFVLLLCYHIDLSGNNNK